MDATRKAAIASRIKQLREDSPYTQDKMAELLVMTTRGYQKWEETGIKDLDKAEKLAEVHSKWMEGVDAAYILGESETAKDLRARTETPSPATQLAQLQETLDLLAAAVQKVAGDTARLERMFQEHLDMRPQQGQEGASG